MVAYADILYHGSHVVAYARTFNHMLAYATISSFQYHQFPSRITNSPETSRHHYCLPCITDSIQTSIIPARHHKFQFNIINSPATSQPPLHQHHYLHCNAINSCPTSSIISNIPNSFQDCYFLSNLNTSQPTPLLNFLWHHSILADINNSTPTSSTLTQNPELFSSIAHSPSNILGSPRKSWSPFQHQ